MKRLILLIGSTETLEYFSLQMAEYFLAAGREVFLWDMGKPAESIDEFEKIPDKENSVLITFNFIGLG
ncbi:MAG: glycosyltransferase family 1 protein, partial [Lachnospiraceae bacterium]|nr:glycosyltransferase family 1 protein [Lachnospiraceae bacterium]